MTVELIPAVRTLRLKVNSEAYSWLNAAAIEVNQVWNYANATGDKAARPFAGPAKWLSAFDLDKLTAGASQYFDRIGWWLCVPVAIARVNTPAPDRAVGLDLGLKDTVATSDGEKLEAREFYRRIEQKIAQAQRRGHKRQAKRLHRQAARRRKDALHKFSRGIVNRYRTIRVGDVSSLKLAKTRLAKSVLDAGWGMLKAQLKYKGEYAGRCVQIVTERNTTRTCSSCGSLTGPSGLDMLAVRVWMCGECGVTHDRDINAARNILFAGRCSPSVSGNEPPSAVAEPSPTYGRYEAGNGALRMAT